MRGLTDRAKRIAPSNPLMLVRVMVVNPSSSQSVLPPSQRADSPTTFSDVGLAEIVKSFWPVTAVTVMEPEAPILPL